MWRTPKREKPPNCTAVRMGTGWSHWAAASAALATRRAVTDTAKVGSSGRAFQILHPCPFLSISLCLRLSAAPPPVILVAPPLCLCTTYAAPASLHHCLCSLFISPFILPTLRGCPSAHIPSPQSNTLNAKSISISCCWDDIKRGNKSKWE